MFSCGGRQTDALSRYIGGMKVKTSVTRSSALLEEIDGADTNRTAFLDRAARVYLSRTAKAARDLRDAEILDGNAERLNREAAEVLEYQDLSE